MTIRGINSYLQKESNFKQIVKLLYRNKECSRVSLARELKLTQAAITKLINPLIESGLVEEAELIETAAGRKPKQLKLVSDKFHIVSGRINRDYVSAALYDLRGHLISEKTESLITHTAPSVALDTFEKLAEKLIKGTNSNILGLGMAVPGPFNINTNKISLMTGFSSWSDIDIKHELEERLNIPCFVEQDANCGAIAELWRGKHQFSENVIYITADRGVGAGIVIDGSIYHGRSGYAGEFGHMSICHDGPKCECGNQGCLELYCSSIALEKEYSALGGPSISATEIISLAKGGDSMAQTAYLKIIKYLARGTVGLINILNPDAVIYADKISEGGDFFLDNITDLIKQYSLPEIADRIKVSLSNFSEDPTMLGASVLVLEKMLEKSCEVFM